MSEEDNKAHMDVVASVDGMELFLGHGEVELVEDKELQLRIFSTFVMKIAWDLEERADRYKDFQPRCFRTVLGGAIDLWWEIYPDVFVDGESLEAAHEAYKDDMQAVNLETLQGHYNDNIEEVSSE